MKKHELNLTSNIYSEQTLDENYHLFNVSDWASISLCQNLTERFIKKHFNKLNLNALMYNTNISKKIKEELSLLEEII